MNNSNTNTNSNSNSNSNSNVPITPTTTNLTSTPTETSNNNSTNSTTPVKKLSITEIVNAKILGHRSKEQTEKENKNKYIEEDSPADIQKKREEQEKLDCLLNVQVLKGELVNSHPSYQVLLILYFC